MLEIVALSLFLAVVAVPGFRLIRETVRHQKALQSAIRLAHDPARKPGSTPNNANRYHAVTVVRGQEACSPSAQLNGKRFLSREAPSLPLSGCQVRRCGCRYLHHADRRADDRRFPFGVRKHSESAVAAERRRGDRRKSTDMVFS